MPGGCIIVMPGGCIAAPDDTGGGGNCVGGADIVCGCRWVGVWCGCVDALLLNKPKSLFGRPFPCLSFSFYFQNGKRKSFWPFFSSVSLVYVSVVCALSVQPAFSAAATVRHVPLRTLRTRVVSQPDSTLLPGGARHRCNLESEGQLSHCSLSLQIARMDL